MSKRPALRQGLALIARVLQASMGNGQWFFSLLSSPLQALVEAESTLRNAWKQEITCCSARKVRSLGVNSRSFQAPELLWTIAKLLRKSPDLPILSARNRDGIWTLFNTAADGAWIGWECCA